MIRLEFKIPFRDKLAFESNSKLPNSISDSKPQTPNSKPQTSKLKSPFVKAFPATRLIHFLFPQHNLVIYGNFTIGIVRDMTTLHTDRMQLGNEICLCEQERHLSKRLSCIIHIEPRNDHPDPL